jgi:hypothetical protein
MGRVRRLPGDEEGPRRGLYLFEVEVITPPQAIGLGSYTWRTNWRLSFAKTSPAGKWVNRQL